MHNTIQTSDVDFHAQRRGDNPLAVFLHGFGGDLHTWDALWEALGPEFSGLRYDLRGFGESVCRCDQSFTHADDLARILDASGIERCDLVGVSMGGAIALNFSLTHPERVRSLVLLSPGLVGWEWSHAWTRRWQPIVDLARSGQMDAARRLWWQNPLFDTARAGAAGRTLWDSIQRFSGEQWIRDRHEAMMPDVERLHLLRTRTLLLTGACDVEDFRVIADLIEASADDVRRIDFSGRGHMLHLEDPEQCATAISSFWRARPAAELSRDEPHTSC